MTPLRIRQSRGKAAGYLAGAAAPIALGVWMLASFDNNFAIGVGGALVLLFGYHALYFTLVLIRPSGMILSVDGLRIEHGRGGPAWPWPTIKRATTVRLGGFKVVRLELTDGKVAGVHSVWASGPQQLADEINRWRNLHGDRNTPPEPVPEREAAIADPIVS